MRARPAKRSPAHIRRIQPQVVVTFDPFGAYGHPDHIAISQLTAAAIVRAADAHQCRSSTTSSMASRKWAAYQAAFKTLTSNCRRRGPCGDRRGRTGRLRRGRCAGRMADGVACSAVPQDPDEHLQERREPHGRRSESHLGNRRVLPGVQPGERWTTGETDLFEGMR